MFQHPLFDVTLSNYETKHIPFVMNQKAFHNFCLRTDFISVEIHGIRAISALGRSKSAFRSWKRKSEQQSSLE
jgi:hypothetical protein